MRQEATTGDRVRDVRKRRGLSQRQLGDLSGISVSLVRKLEQGDYGHVRMETLHKLAAALRVPTTMLTGNSDDAREAVATSGDVAADWQPVQRALAGMIGQPEEQPTAAGLKDATLALAPILSGHRYAEARLILPQIIRDGDALPPGPESRQLQSSILNTVGYLLTQAHQYALAELTLLRAIDAAGDDKQKAAAAADTMLWLYLRQGQLSAARQFAAHWADLTEPRFSRATVLELILWGRFLLNMANAAIRDNRPGEAEDALSLAAAAAARLDREVRRHPNSQCVFGPVSVAYIRAETRIISGEPGQALSIAAALPGDPPYPDMVSRLRHQLDVANAKAMLHEYGEAFILLQQVRERAPEWLVNQRYAQDILSGIISHRRTLRPEMREMADFMRLAL